MISTQPMDSEEHGIENLTKDKNNILMTYYEKEDYDADAAAAIITCSSISSTDPHYGNTTSNIADIRSTTE